MKEFEHKREIMLMYDRTAETYDGRYFEEQDAKIRAALNSKPLTFNSKNVVLDLGCGTGFLFPHLREKVEMLVGLDFSPNILKLAKKRTTDNVSLIRADADYMPFRKHVFDVVFAFTLLQNMPNPAKTLDEMKRVTKPYGKMVVTALKRKFSLETFQRLLEHGNLQILEWLDGDLKGYMAICVAT